VFVCGGRSGPRACVSGWKGGFCVCIAAGQMLTALPASTSLPLKSRLFIEIENEAVCGGGREGERQGARERGLLKSFHFQHLKSINSCAAFFLLKSYCCLSSSAPFSSALSFWHA